MPYKKLPKFSATYDADCIFANVRRFGVGLNTALLLVAITRRHAVVGCHAVLLLVPRRHELFEPNTLSWAFHTTQPSS